MKQAMRWIAVVAVLGVVAAACGGNGTSNEPTSAAPTGTDIPTGGTINMAAVGDVSAAFDPAKEYYQLSFEYLPLLPAPHALRHERSGSRAGWLGAPARPRDRPAARCPRMG